MSEVLQCDIHGYAHSCRTKVGVKVVQFVQRMLRRLSWKYITVIAWTVCGSLFCEKPARESSGAIYARDPKYLFVQKKALSCGK